MERIFVSASQFLSSTGVFEKCIGSQKGFIEIAIGKDQMHLHKVEDSGVSSACCDFDILTLQECKISNADFYDVYSGIKTFDIRKDDRNPKYEVGQILNLKAYDLEKDKYTGDSLIRKIQYVLRDNNVKEGFCILGLEKL